METVAREIFYKEGGGINKITSEANWIEQKEQNKTRLVESETLNVG